MNRFVIKTLGCKVNQCESAALAHGLESSGYTAAPKGSAAELVVINTCTVTGRAAMQSRQAVRQAIRNHPHARIVVTGCYAQTALEELRAIHGIDLIVGHVDKHAIPELLEQCRSKIEPLIVHQEIRHAQRFSALSWAAPEKRTRAFLKIQDGCNGKCSYCIVPYARGHSRSMAFSDVMQHFHRLDAAGYREVVLTGIHLGAYGADFSPAATLADLIDRILQAEFEQRVRLSSIEPTEVDSRILDRMVDSGRLCPHWHIPLQSGADSILARMGRPYTCADYARIINTIHSRLPNAAIGADVLVGFPGESDAAYQQSYEMISELPLSYLHIFPFSPRKGTPAAEFNGRPPEGIVSKRCHQLRRLSEEKRKRFYNSLIGTDAQVLIETPTDPQTGLAKGLSENFVPMFVQAKNLLPNTVVRARIEKVSGQNVLARLVEGKDG